MRGDFAVNACLAAAVFMGVAAGCAKKEKDPLDLIKALIPVVEQRLNKRDLAGLKGMGTVQFESNAFVIDVFGERVRDSVDLSLSRIQLDGADATLILNMNSHAVAGETRELHLYLKGDGKWRIDRYEILQPGADSLDSETLNPDTTRGV